MLLHLADKPGLQVWSWATGASRWKCAMPEKITCLAVSSDGVYLAAGAPSGANRISHLLEMQLHYSILFHFYRITCLFSLWFFIRAFLCASFCIGSVQARFFCGM
jgi:hypothetical protein